MIAWLKTAQTRREFLRTLGRGAALAAILGAASAAAFRRGGRPASQTCINRSVCRGCAAFDGCGLPAALSARQAPGDRDEWPKASTTTE